MPTYTSHYNLKKPTPGNHEPFDIEDQNGNMELLDEALWASPSTYKRALTSSDDANSIVDGIYYLQATANHPLNVPGDAQYCFLVQISNSAIKHQYIFRPTSGIMWMRELSGNPNAWTAWQGDSSVVTVNLSGSDSYYQYYKRNGIVYLYVFHKVSVATIRTWETRNLGTLPSGFRPKQSIVFPFVTDRASSAGCSLAVQSNGLIYINGRYTGASDTSDILQTTLCFPG